VKGDDWDAPGNGSSSDFNCIPPGGLNLVRDILDGVMPDTQLRVDTPPECSETSQEYLKWEDRQEKRKKWRLNREESLNILQLKMPKFAQSHVDDCMKILRLEERTDPMPFCWPLDEVRFLFENKTAHEKNIEEDGSDSAPEAEEESFSDVEEEETSASEDGANDLLPDAEAINQGHPNRRAEPKTAVDLVLKQFELTQGPREGDYWLLKPNEDRSGHEKAAPFYIGKVKRNDVDAKASYVMWYSPADGWEGESPYTGKYRQEKASCSITSLDKVPWDVGWQWPIVFKKNMQPQISCLKPMRKWAKRFAEQEQENGSADIRIGSAALPVSDSDSG
jgi:hypothetical protein